MQSLRLLSPFSVRICDASAAPKIKQIDIFQEMYELDKAQRCSLLDKKSVAQ